MDISRHKELFNPEEFTTPINIIGVGATGSWLALMLAKLGIKGELINVWDFDIVEEHNIANQAFNLYDVGDLKIKSLYHIIKNSTETKINIKEKYTNEKLFGYVFLMVDSMAERKRIWEENIKMKLSVLYLIEPRMGLDVGRVYNIDPVNLNHIKEYEKTYYPDDVAEVSACGNSMTVISSATAIASWCCRQLINHVNGVDLDNEILLDFKYNNIIASTW